MVGGGGDAYKFYTPFPTPKMLRLSQGPFSKWHVPRAPILAYIDVFRGCYAQAKSF